MRNCGRIQLEFGPNVVRQRFLLHWNNPKSAKLFNDLFHRLVFFVPLGVLDRNLRPHHLAQQSTEYSLVADRESAHVANQPVLAAAIAPDQVGSRDDYLLDFARDYVLRPGLATAVLSSSLGLVRAAKAGALCRTIYRLF